MQQIEQDRRRDITGVSDDAPSACGIRPAAHRSLFVLAPCCLFLAGLVVLTPTSARPEEPQMDAPREGGSQDPTPETDDSLNVESGTEHLNPFRTGAGGMPAGESGPGLDALLQLPSSFRARETPSVAGADEAEWRRRFIHAEEKLANAQQELARVKRELDEVAEGGGASQWAVAPPGASGGSDGGLSTSPLSFKHREAMRRSRDELEAAERALRELKIEADLAGVPVAWRAAAAPGSTRAIQN